MPPRRRRLQPTPFRRRLLPPALLLLALALAPQPAAAGEAGSGPLPAAAPVDGEGRMHIGEGDRCPVCAMQVQAHRKFAGAIQLTDGTTFYFCGTGCMIRSWIHPEAFLKVPGERLRRCVVQDYFTGEHVDGMSVTWVAGSDVVGPMGPALVPLKSAEDLAAFQRRHGGRHTFRLAEMNDAVWERVTGKKAAPGKP